MKAYKGFNRDLTCRGFQYEEGGEYETDTAQLCRSGFHAIEAPIDVLRYYPSASSVYHEVEVDGVDPKREDDSKVAAKKIRIGARVSLAQIVQAQVDYVFERSDKSTRKSSDTDNGAATASGENGAATASGRYGAATASGWSGAATASGGSGAATASGWYGAATASGWYGAATASGWSGAATASGEYGAATASGRYGAATASGEYGAATASGEYGAATASGEYGAATASGRYGAATASGEESIAIVTGKDGRASGIEGAWIVLTERDDDWHILGVKAVKVGSRVNGVRVEPGVFYELRGGKVAAVSS